jgi:L-threonylcarbamoyladenylate synthase
MTKTYESVSKAPELIATAVEHLRAGEVVCFPTETTYGLAVDASNPEALERLLEVKGRSARETIALIAADIDQARSIASVWPESATRLAEKHWPGPLTLVVAAKPGLDPAVVGADGGVGVRVSGHPWARALARSLGRPITATSANRHGAAAALCGKDAQEVFGSEVSFYLDDGETHEPGASTIVTVSLNGKIGVIRHGLVHVEAS